MGFGEGARDVITVYGRREGSFVSACALVESVILRARYSSAEIVGRMRNGLAECRFSYEQADSLITPRTPVSWYLDNAHAVPYARVQGGPRGVLPETMLASE